MNSLRRLLILQLRDWLNVLENDNVPDGQAIDHAPEIFEIRYESDRRLWHELRSINQKLDTLSDSKSRFVCQLNEDKNVYHLISSLANYKEAIKDLRSWMVGTESLIITDPYFFSFKRTKVYRTEHSYVDAIIEMLPNNLSRVEVFHDIGANRRIYNRFQKHCQSKQIRFRNYPTNEIHDRVLIKDNSDAKAIGTSFGGLGNRIAFILDIPDDDREKFMQELHRIKVLSHTGAT